MKIGVFVGSFNPVHNGHIKIVNYLLDNYLDKVIIIPTKNYWNKQNLEKLEDRINMLKVFENKNIIIDTKNNNEDYTYSIMDNLSIEYPNDILYLILGADNLIQFNKWNNYKELLKYHLLIINRNNIDIEYYLKKLEKHNNYLITRELPNIDISSTEIRKKIKENDYKSLKKVLNKKVLKYIIDNTLYKEV